MTLQLRNTTTGRTYEVPAGSVIEILDPRGALAMIVNASGDVAAVATPGETEFDRYTQAYGLGVAPHIKHKP